MNGINQILKEIKEKTDFKIKDIAKEVGISDRTLRRWKNGAQPHPLHLREFEKVIERIKNFCQEKGIEI